MHQNKNTKALEVGSVEGSVEDSS